MTTILITVTSALVGLVLGLVLGFMTSYHLLYRGLSHDYLNLVKDMQNMKRQGFVPQFELQQRVERDAASDFVEF